MIKLLLTTALSCLILSGCFGTTKPPEVVYKDRIVAVTTDQSYFITKTTPRPPDRQEFMEVSDRERVVLSTAYAKQLLSLVKELKAQIVMIYEVEQKTKQTLEKENP